MRDSLQRPGSCREGALLLIHFRFSVSTLSPLRFPGPRGLSRAIPTCSAPCRKRASHKAIMEGVEDLAKVLIDASILLRSNGRLGLRAVCSSATLARAVLCLESFLVTPMRFVPSAAWLFLRRSWALITLKPGSRSRVAARKVVLAAARVALTRPLLARILKPLLGRFPKLKRRIVAGLPAELVLHVFVSSAPTSDTLLSERERFVYARLKVALGKRPS
jgi:hypothetical protein